MCAWIDFHPRFVTFNLGSFTLLICFISKDFKKIGLMLCILYFHCKHRKLIVKKNFVNIKSKF